MTRCWSGWSEDKGKGTANAGSSTACLTKCREPLRSGRHGVGVVGARTRARARRMQVLRLRVSRSAVSHFAQDDTVLEWLGVGVVGARTRATATVCDRFRRLPAVCFRFLQAKWP